MKTKSNFDKVRDFNEQFEQSIASKPQFSIFKENAKLLAFRMSLITEEYHELQDALTNKDFTETIDALVDLIYVIHGFGQTLGVNLEHAFDIVHESNMSKLCDTIQEAEESCIWLKEHKPEYNPGYRRTKNGSKYLVYDTVTGKVLKSKYYKAADFSEIF